MLIRSTKNRKLVPHLLCCLELIRTFSHRQGKSVLDAVDALVLRPVVHDVRWMSSVPRDQEDIEDEDPDAHKALDHSAHMVGGDQGLQKSGQEIRVGS